MIDIARNLSLEYHIRRAALKLLPIMQTRIYRLPRAEGPPKRVSDYSIQKKLGASAKKNLKIIFIPSHFAIGVRANRAASPSQSDPLNPSIAS